MASHRSLAELTLHWCAGEVAPGSGVKISQKEHEALAKTSREASKASGVALLQAAAAEMQAGDSPVLGLIAAVIEDDEAIANLEDRLAAASQQTGSPRERAALVGHHFKDWMNENAGDELPDKMQGWLQRGWPDLRARGGVTSFYQAFCGSLQRAVRQDQTTWDELLKPTGIDATTWRQWLIREADTGMRPAPRSGGKKAAKVFAVLAMIAVMAGGAGWYWWKEIRERLQALDQLRSANSEMASPSPDDPQKTPPSPGPTPKPKTVQQAPPKTPATPAPTESGTSAAPATPAPPVAAGTSEPVPRVSVRPEPLTEAARLMTSAEATLTTPNHDTGDRLARSAQDILTVRLPANDAQLAEAFSRVAQYWERREDWAEAARVYQRAVKAYEKTPAENTNPQLQAVGHWASALRHSGRNAEAEQLYRTLLQAYDGMGSELHPEMASVAHNLGNVLFATGRLRDAREAYALALKLMGDRQADPQAQPLIARFKESYSECLRKLGVSETQIEADVRQTLGVKPAPKLPAFR